MVYRNGDIYYGGWHKGLRHGEGEITFNDNICCLGNWKKDQMQGIHKCYLDGVFYLEGKFKNHKLI